MSFSLHRSRTSIELLAALAVTTAILAPGAHAANSTPTFPVPASAKVPPTTTATGAIAPTTSTAPTTTYTSPASTVPTTTAVAPVGSTPTATTKALGPARSERASKLSTPAIALAALGAALVLLCLAWALARASAYEPHWARSLRHSLAEGGFRASATWAEFTDWARLGK